MTPEEEIDRIKEEYKEHWHRLKNHPGILVALSNNDPVKLGEIAAMVIHGSYQDLATARDLRHQVRVYVNYEPFGFESLESAKVFIACKHKMDKTARIDFVAIRNENGNFETLIEWEYYDDFLNSHDPQWTQKARALMEKKKSFVLVGFDFSFHNEDARTLAQEFSYTRSIQPNTNKVFFKPRNSN